MQAFGMIWWTSTVGVQRSTDASLCKPRHEVMQDEVCVGAKQGGASLFLAATSFARAAHRSSPALVGILPFALQPVFTPWPILIMMYVQTTCYQNSKRPAFCSQ